MLLSHLASPGGDSNIDKNLGSTADFDLRLKPSLVVRARNLATAGFDQSAERQDFDAAHDDVCVLRNGKADGVADLIASIGIGLV